MGRKSAIQKATERELAKFDKNYASDPDVQARVLQKVLPLVQMAKNNRMSKEQEWLEDFRLWSCQLSSLQIFQGRSNLFIPELNNQVETTVSKFQQGLFPSDDYFFCTPTKTTDLEQAKKIQAALKHTLDYKNQLPNLMERYQRQKALYGTCFMKGEFKNQTKDIFTKLPDGKIVKVTTPFKQGVYWRQTDIFHSYIYPELAPDLDSADIWFEETFQHKRALEDSGLYENLSTVPEVPQQYADLQWVDTIRLTIENLNSTAAQTAYGVLVTECWLDFDINEGEFVPCVITIANMGEVIRVQRNPFWFQKPPVVMGRYLKSPAASAYGHSLAERLRSLQYQMNDLANQTMDSMNFSLNPIAVIDPGYGTDINGFKLQPGAKWYANPQSVDMKVFPDVSVQGFNGMNQVRAMVQQFSDNAPTIAPQLSGKARSATAAQAVSNEISANLRAMIRSDEDDVLIPILKMTHSMMLQFQDYEEQIRTQGPDGAWMMMNVNPADLIGDVDFEWKGASEQQREAIERQQLMAFFNLALQINAQMPGQVDLPLLFQKVAREAFDMKLEDVFPAVRDKYTVDPSIENLILDDARDVKVNPGDNFEEHMLVHEEGRKAAKDEDVKIAYLRHMEQHRLQQQARQLLMQQQAQLQLMQQEPQEPGAKEGNPYQTPATPEGMLKGLRAVEPNQ